MITVRECKVLTIPEMREKFRPDVGNTKFKIPSVVYELP